MFIWCIFANNLEGRKGVGDTLSKDSLCRLEYLVSLFKSKRSYNSWYTLFSAQAFKTTFCAGFLLRLWTILTLLLGTRWLSLCVVDAQTCVFDNLDFYKLNYQLKIHLNFQFLVFIEFFIIFLILLTIFCASFCTKLSKMNFFLYRKANI